LNRKWDKIDDNSLGCNFFDEIKEQVIKLYNEGNNLHKISKILNENERLNPRQKEIVPGVINYYFDNIDTADLDNGYKVKIVRTFYYRTPGTTGYSETSNSEKNPQITNIQSTLLNSLGKSIGNKRFEGSNEFMMMNLGKEKVINYIKSWWEDKIKKLQASNKLK
jgi:hypothetical protein